jgi:hypothetical protein
VPSVIAGHFFQNTMTIPNQLQMNRGDSRGWLSADAARVAYALTGNELSKLKRDLKTTGGVCPRKGFSIDALELMVPRMRQETI